VLQVQGGSEPVACLAIVRVESAECLLQARAHRMALRFGDFLGQSAGLELGHQLAQERLLAQQHLPLKPLPGRGDSNAFFDKGHIAPAGRRQGDGKMRQQRVGIQKCGEVFQSGVAR
jgi:hypothetical protein